MQICVVRTLNILLHVQFTTKQTANQTPCITGLEEHSVRALQTEFRQLTKCNVYISLYDKVHKLFMIETGSSIATYDN